MQLTMAIDFGDIFEESGNSLKSLVLSICFLRETIHFIHFLVHE